MVGWGDDGLNMDRTLYVFPFSCFPPKVTSMQNFIDRLTDEICGSLVSFSYTAVKLWNQLPNDLKEVKTLPVFKKKLREFVFRTY